MADPTYHLNRDYRSNSRLNTQHQILRRTFSYLIHPRIKLPATAKKADVGVGTGCWLFDVGRELPDTVSLHGFDIDLRQCPNTKWCPANVKLQKWDVYDSLPEGTASIYDLVHIRAFIQVVRDSVPGPVVEQLKKLVKPGGYVQWTDLDVWSARVKKVQDDVESSATEALLRRLKGILTARAGSEPGWAARLPEIFRARGLEDVQLHRVTDREDDLPNWHDNLLLGAEEFSNFAPDGEDFRKLIDQASAESVASNRGVAIAFDHLTVTGRAMTE